MPDVEKKKAPATKKNLAAGIFVILFGFTIGVLTFLTIIGPIIGVLVIAAGIYLIVRSARGNETPV